MADASGVRVASRFDPVRYLADAGEVPPLTVALLGLYDAIFYTPADEVHALFEALPNRVLLAYHNVQKAIEKEIERV